MTVRGEDSYRRGAEVIVRSDRGLETGIVLCEASEDALSHLDQAPAGQIVRLLSSEDAGEINQLDGTRGSKIEACQKHIDRLGLKMRLVEVEQSVSYTHLTLPTNREV